MWSSILLRFHSNKFPTRGSYRSCPRSLCFHCANRPFALFLDSRYAVSFSGTEYCRAGIIFDRCVSIVVVLSPATSLVLTRNSREWTLQGRWRHRSLCGNAAMKRFVRSVSGRHYKVNIFYNCLINLFIFPHTTSKSIDIISWQFVWKRAIITVQTFEMGAILASFLGI
jgi:hypothetical protein